MLTGLAREQQEIAALHSVSGSLRAEKDTLHSSLTALQDMLLQQEQEYQRRSTGQGQAHALAVELEASLCKG
jgi:hypothetical protein